MTTLTSPGVAMRKEAQYTRPCPLCESDASDPLFTYTYDFLKGVRSHPESWLEKIGWDKDVTSTIVKCRNCSGMYVRDIFPNFEKGYNELSEDEVRALWANYDSYKTGVYIEYKIGVVHKLNMLARNRFHRNLKFLDYGAGSGSWCNIARAFGIKDVFAYEPHNSYHPKHMEKHNFPGIVASRNWEEIEKHGPFDIVVCNAAFEHFVEPRSDMKRIHANMSKGGFFHINNPFMDLKKELAELKTAKTITKKMALSHYHPGHVNYFTPREFKFFLKQFNFTPTNVLPDRLMQTGNPKVLARNLVKRLMVGLKLYEPRAYILTKE